MGHVRTWREVSPLIRKLTHWARSKGYRVTSVVRPNAITHASGRALDIAPLMYKPNWATLKEAQRLYAILADQFSPRLMVVGEDDHIHIGTDAPFGAGYDGKDGRILPSI